MPILKPISGHGSTGGIRRYLEKGGRALARDLFNLSYDERDAGALAPLAERVVVASLHAERDAALLAFGGAGFLFHGGFLSSGPQRGGRVSLGARGIPRRRRPGPGAASGTGPRESGLPNGPRHDGSEAARSPSAMDARRDVGRHRLLAGFRA